MTVSFHMHGHYFFPGTGALEDVGEQRGRFCSLNVPLTAGTDNGTFLRLFKRVMRRTMEVYQPECIVLQCGELAEHRTEPSCLPLASESGGAALNLGTMGAKRVQAHHAASLCRCPSQGGSCCMLHGSDLQRPDLIPCTLAPEATRCHWVQPGSMSGVEQPAMLAVEAPAPDTGVALSGC